MNFFAIIGRRSIKAKNGFACLAQLNCGWAYIASLGVSNVWMLCGGQIDGSCWKSACARVWANNISPKLCRLFVSHSIFKTLVSVKMPAWLGHAFSTLSMQRASAKMHALSKLLSFDGSYLFYSERGSLMIERLWQLALSAGFGLALQLFYKAQHSL
jgi:hypothetical protein